MERRFWTEPRRYGFAVYANCLICGRLLRMGGWDGEHLSEDSVLEKLEAEHTDETLAEVCLRSGEGHTEEEWLAHHPLELEEVGLKQCN